MTMTIPITIYLFLGCLSWLGGIIIGTLWEQAGIWLILLLCLIVLVWKMPRWWSIFLCIICLFLGWGWSTYSLAHIRTERDILGERVGWEGFSHQIVGTAGPLLSVNDYNRRYQVRVQSIDGKADTSMVTLIVPPNITMTAGDTVTAFGRFRFPLDTPDYAGEKVLWYRGMIAEFQSFQNSKQAPQTYSYTVQIQQWFDARLRSLFPPSGYAILSGILLGQRNAMTSEMTQQLKASGLMHLMVVSGGNIMMLIIFLSLFIRSLPIYMRILIIAFTVCGFTLIVGGDMPVWRAALMGTIGYTAALWGYRFPALILPLIVAVLIAMWNPLSIIYDIGLQLSFLSVICIIVWGKKFAHTLRFLGDFFAEASALTIAATIGTFPITLYYFGTFSLIGPIANMLAAPAIPLLMYSGILTLFVSTFSHTAAIWIGYIPWIGTTYLSALITFFGSQRWSLLTVDIAAYKSLFIVLSLGVLCILIVQTQRKKV